MRNKILMIVTILTLLLSGCSAKHTTPEVSVYPGMIEDYFVSEFDQAPYPESALAEITAKSIPAAYQEAPDTINRLVVRTADMSIEVMDTVLVIDEIGNIAVQFGGFIVTSNTYQRTNTYNAESISLPYGEVTIRVRAEHFDEAIKQIEALTPDIEKHVKAKVISGDDITSDYVDANSRLKSLETTVNKLYEIMDSAKKTEDILSVYAQISEKESQIEVLKGKIKYMEDSAALSSITIQIDPILPEGKIEIKGWSFMTIVKDAVQNLIDSAQVLGEILIYFVISVLPFLLIILIPFFLILRWLFRKLSRAAEKNSNKNNKLN